MRFDTGGGGWGGGGGGGELFGVRVLEGLGFFLLVSFLSFFSVREKWERRGAEGRKREIGKRQRKFMLFMK